MGPWDDGNDGKVRLVPHHGWLVWSKKGAPQFGGGRCPAHGLCTESTDLVQGLGAHDREGKRHGDFSGASSIVAAVEVEDAGPGGIAREKHASVSDRRASISSASRS